MPQRTAGQRKGANVTRGYYWGCGGQEGCPGNGAPGQRGPVPRLCEPVCRGQLAILLLPLHSLSPTLQNTGMDGGIVECLSFQPTLSSHISIL